MFSNVALCHKSWRFPELSRANGMTFTEGIFRLLITNEILEESDFNGTLGLGKSGYARVHFSEWKEVCVRLVIQSTRTLSYLYHR